MAKQHKMGQKQARADRKMARVILSVKNSKGSYSFRESIMEEDKAKEFVQQQKQNS